MIEITNLPDELTVRGHAADSNHPRNEETIAACASITAAVQLLICCIYSVTDDAPEHELRQDGYFRLKTAGLSLPSREIVKAFVTGMRQISDAYPEYIHVK